MEVLSITEKYNLRSFQFGKATTFKLASCINLLPLKLQDLYLANVQNSFNFTVRN